jgi:hypothetical protein
MYLLCPVSSFLNFYILVSLTVTSVLSLCLALWGNFGWYRFLAAWTQVNQELQQQLTVLNQVC